MILLTATIFESGPRPTLIEMFLQVGLNIFMGLIHFQKYWLLRFDQGGNEFS